MDLRDKVSQAPALPGVYLYKDAGGRVIYVGKAKNLRSRVRSYFSEDNLADIKTGTLISEARDIEYILVDNEKEALALENNLIKHWKPRFNVLLRDDKTYPYIKLTNELFPRVYVTRRLTKDGSSFYGPYFPGNLAHRLVHFINRYFGVPSCKIDLKRRRPYPCLQYHIGRCLGPCVEGLTTEEAYVRAVREVRLFLEGKHRDLIAELRSHMEQASAEMRFEQAAVLRDAIATLEEMDQKQKMAAAKGEDTDIFGFYAEPPLVACNVFHLRNGRVVDRREFFWEDRERFEPAEFISSLLKQYYLDQQYVPASIYVPLDFEERELLEEVLAEKRGHKVEIFTPQRGQKKAMLAFAETNAKHLFEQRFRVMKPSAQAIRESLQEILGLEQAPRRIECFDISHIQGTDKVASMVVWEDGRMKKSDYRKFIIREVEGNDDFASMREVIRRRYSRLKNEAQRMPGLVLVDGGLGQLHAAAEALESIGIVDQPLASIAKREEWIYVYGQEEEPIVLDKFSPVLHLIQSVRDEAHRFAVSFHRSRRDAARLGSELEGIPGIGPKTVRKLLKHFGSAERVRQATESELMMVVGRAATRRLLAEFREKATQAPDS
ncbi:MAG TPA: excinuclease ABC subunit UvrC [Bryobacteraceae bacterium]|nr:excinuclease ABC subunit UvrC [Bryobacteraceae bacterium]HOQ45863.1 excinuclease ABC subunit UvrC [Bryobacteraceae bacterium]HPQ13733.1 excinuclease ABC subunit UvrC [Bryobacteraceae bacterium]HPU70928.1 excinuclease ABC subunit UvrC [Bryobacteraceae bacterium]